MIIGSVSENNDLEKRVSITPEIAKKAVKIGSKVLWLQFGIHHDEAKKISEGAKMKFVSDKCIKQEYQKLFEKSHPVFPVLRN